MEGIFQFIGLGGDVGIWVLLYVMWRNDIRLLRVEINLDHHLKFEHGLTQE